MASYKSAANHGFMDQVSVHREHATEMIKEWMTNASRGNATIWLNGQQIPLSIKHMSTTLNSVVAPLIFPKGPDALEILRTRAASTFWKPQVSKEIIRTFIFATTKSELGDVNGMMKPVQYLVQDALDENLEWKNDIPNGHQFKAVYDFINSTIKNFISHGNTQTLFDLTERFAELTRPPYGLAGNFASAAMVAFAMRPWINKIYDQVGKPRSADNLADDVATLITYWGKGKSTNKLNFKFQTPQENKLCKELVRLFRLDKLSGYSDVSSMKDARFALTGVYVKLKGYPLWSLKYMTEDFIHTMPVLTFNEEIKRLIDNVVAICEERDIKNVQLITGTLDLIEKYRSDFPDILNKPGSFQNGFENFLLSNATVQLQPQEILQAYDYITKHLESTIGYWTEAEVTEMLMKWRIAERDRIEAERRKKEEEERLKKAAQEQKALEEERKRYAAQLEEAKKIIGDPHQVPMKKVSARELIDSINDPDSLRKILDRVIDLGYEYILNTILNTNNDA